MNESFVVHAEYLLDIPEENKHQFYAYIMDYGIFGTIPQVKGFELKAWNSIQRRIDQDRLRYSQQTFKKRINAINNRIKNGQATQNDMDNLTVYTRQYDELTDILNKCISYSSYNTYNTHTGVSVSVSDSVSDSVSVSVSDIVSVSDDDDDSADTNPSSSLPEPQANYSNQIHELWTKSNLPCSKDLFQFQCKDFKPALEILKGIHSEDVIKACENYIKELHKKTSYIEKEYSFLGFVQSKTFNNCLPSNYRAKNFTRYGESHNEESRMNEVEKAAILSNVVRV